MRKTPDPAAPTDATSVARGLVVVDSPEAALSELTSREVFEAMFASSSEMLCVRDLRGMLLRMSPAWSTNLGYPLDVILGAPMLDLVHPDDVWATHDIMQGVDETHMVLGFRNRYRTVEGRYLLFEWTARQFGEYVFGLARVVG